MAECFVGSVPGMQRSRGHDILGDLAGAVVTENGYQLQRMTLKPDGGSGDLLCRLGWEIIERGKATLAGTEARASLISPLMKMTGSLLSKGSTLLRENRYFNNILLSHYRETIAGIAPKLIISSHYLAFDIPESDSRGIMIGPDFFVQPAAKRSLSRMPVKVLSPLWNYSDSLAALSPELEIQTTGMIVPEDCYESINPRLRTQDLINSGNASHRAFISIGGSGPERPEAAKAIAWLLDAGIKTTVICGTQRSDCLEYRRTLAEKFGTDPNLKLIGGVPGYTREMELTDYRSELANPQNTLCLSRPNETLMLAASLGYEVLMFRPYQVHEQQAYNWIRSGKHLQTFTDAHTDGIANFEPADFLNGNYFIRACHPDDALSHMLD